MKGPYHDFEGIPEVTVQELNDRKSDNQKEEYILIDIREEIIYQNGHIPNAVSVPVNVDIIGMQECAKRIKEQYTTTHKIIVYCQHGEKSQYVVKSLLSSGFQAFNLRGGYLEWLFQNEKTVDTKRYARNIILDDIGMQGQLKLRNAKVLIVGAGGLGAPAALYLAAAGVGTIGIVDNDKVELSNLQRQIIHSTKTIGVEKVISAKETIENLNPDVHVKTYALRVTPENIMQLISEYDFVIDAVDNFETKFLINDACILAKKAYCHGGILKYQGQVMTVVPDKGPCYRCIFEDIPEKGAVPNCSEAGVLGAMAGIIGSVQALEALKYILGIGELLVGRMFIFDGLLLKSREITLPKKSTFCRVCGPKADIVDVEKNKRNYQAKNSCEWKRGDT